MVTASAGPAPQLVEVSTSAATPSVRDHLNARLATIAPADLTALVNLASWAHAQGLVDEADQLCRRVLEADPLHESAYIELMAVAQHRELAQDSPALELAATLLPPRFKSYATKRFVVVSDTGAQWSVAQAERLERTHHQFHRFATKLGLRPLPLRHKLVCVLFNNRDEYQAFAREHDHVNDPWVGGYYSPSHDWVVFYHVESNPSVAEARTQLQGMQKTITGIDGQYREAVREGEDAQAEALKQTLNMHEQHIKQQTRKVDEFAAQVSTATTTHEATHQLLFHTHVQSPLRVYPFWISEGLATAFETEEPNHAFGPEHEFAPRRQAADELLREEMAMPLAELIQLMDASKLTTDQVHCVYNQSYALVSWLAVHRRDQLRDYLLSMLEGATGRNKPRPPQVEFETAFGPVEQLERDWLRFERSRLSN